MILHRYIAMKFLRITLMVFLIFFGIMLLIDVIDQLRRFSDADIGFGDALILSAVNVPKTLYTILPLVVILSAITLFIGLARTSELVVIRAAGRSGLRFLLAPVGAAVAVGAFAVAVLNPIVAGTQKEYDKLWSEYTRGGQSILSVTDGGLWLRQGGEDGQTVIQASRANLDGTELFGATFLSFGADGTPQTRVEANHAALDSGVWRLTGTKRWDLTQDNPERSAEAQAGDSTLPTDLTRDSIRDGFGTPSAIPFWDLPRYIAGLERAGFSARSHRVWFQMELAQPLLLAAMVLLAGGFTMRHVRSGNTGTMVLLSLLAGFAIFFLRNFAQVLGENGQIPVAMAAWIPPVAAAMAAMGLLLHLEDG
ncbi:MAG: LPS export ABC transporter permease LptG [Paracoccaceae bacterium]